MSDIKNKIEYLSQFMSGERFDLLGKIADQRTSYIRVCMENIFHGQNASAVIRSAESFGVQHIDIVEDHVPFKPNADIVRGTDKWTSIHRYKEENSSQKLIDKLRKDGYRIVATSPHVNDSTPDNFDVATSPFALFFGTEKQGISHVVEQNADAFIRIPMYGFVESLNISVCAAIVLHTLVEKMRANSSINWKLSDSERDEIMFCWLKRSLKDPENLLKHYGKSSDLSLNEYLKNNE